MNIELFVLGPSVDCFVERTLKLACSKGSHVEARAQHIEFYVSGLPSIYIRQPNLLECCNTLRCQRLHTRFQRLFLCEFYLNIVPLDLLSVLE